jgi:4a-hydroxytetrahydrobiopterin dehydratase
MDRTRLTVADVLADLDGWAPAEGPRDAIAKTFVFSDFKQAFAFMTQIALKAEAMDHHPEWRNVYRTVEVTLTTHDANGVTALDAALAQYCNEAARGRA